MPLISALPEFFSHPAPFRPCIFPPNPWNRTCHLELVRVLFFINGLVSSNIALSFGGVMHPSDLEPEHANWEFD